MGERETQRETRQAMIDRLAAELQPVRRLWPVNARLAMWLLLEASLILIAVVSGARADLPEKIANARFLAEVTLFVIAGVLAAMLALRAAIPGREVTSHELELVMLISGVAILFVFSEPANQDVALSEFIHAGARCALCIGIFAAIPWTAMLWAVRRGAPTSSATAGGLIGAAAFFFSLAITRLGCAIDDRVHFISWHVIPALIGIGLSLLAGTAWLRRKKFLLE